MNQHPESRMRVRFKDCDPLGHLYNTRYLEYMLESREDHILDHYELNLEQYAKEHHRAWVVTGHQIRYLQEASRNEYVRIRSSMIQLSSSHITNEYQMWSDDYRSLKSLMWTHFIHIDLRLKKICPHDPVMMKRLQQILVPADQTDFSERVKFLRDKLASKSES